jgi:hypothetical protein
VVPSEAALFLEKLPPPSAGLSSRGIGNYAAVLPISQRKLVYRMRKEGVGLVEWLKW